MPRCYWVCWKVAWMQSWYHECYYIWMLSSLEKCSNLVIQGWALSHFSHLVIKTLYIHSRLINQHLIRNKDWKFAIWFSGTWETLTMLLSRTVQLCQKASRAERCNQEQVGGKETPEPNPLVMLGVLSPFFLCMLKAAHLQIDTNTCTRAGNILYTDVSQYLAGG